MNFLKRALGPSEPAAKEVVKQTLTGVELFYQEMTTKKEPVGTLPAGVRARG